MEELRAALEDDPDVVVEDLCECAAHGDRRLSEVADTEGPRVVACHPRAVRALFRQAGALLPDDAEIVNLRAHGPARDSGGAEPGVKFDWSPWFPVIDDARCVRCGQCVEFCLFGVYEKDGDERVSVVNPQNCKTNCPACARICPEAAIIFPKSQEEPINGAEITDEADVRANIKVNVEEILGDDVYAALEARKAKRRRLLDQKKTEQALRERAGWTQREL